MVIVDARSGELVEVGKKITYPDGEWWRLIKVQRGIFKARFFVEGNRIAPTPGFRVTPIAKGVSAAWVEGPIRYFHPHFTEHWRIAIVPT